MFFWSQLACIAQKGWKSAPHSRGLWGADLQLLDIRRLRRLISKVASRWGSAADVTPTGTETTGVGVFGGAEAMVHATCASSPWQAVVKLDFINAFNTVRRDSMLETVAQDLPELFTYVSS